MMIFTLLTPLLDQAPTCLAGIGPNDQYEIGLSVETEPTQQPMLLSSAQPTVGAP